MQPSRRALWSSSRSSGTERSPNGHAHVTQDSVRRGNKRGHAVEQMDHARVAFMRHGYARGGELLGIEAAFIPHRVELRSVNVRRRKDREIVRAQGREPRVEAVESRRAIVHEIVLERLLIEKIAMSEDTPGFRISHGIEDRAEHRLEGKPPPAFARKSAYAGRDVRAGGVAANAKAPRVDRENVRLRRQPFDCRDTILESGREFVLGRQTIIEDCDPAAACLREPRAESGMRVKAACHPSSAVEIEERSGNAVFCTVWRIDADL